MVQVAIEGWRDGTLSGGVGKVDMGSLAGWCIGMLDLTMVFWVDPKCEIDLKR